ncbi:MAG: glutamate synthase large subunit [Chloroflexi bacterium]|nr:glutamate synthase large subunit [Chloroflexota bacterium]
MTASKLNKTIPDAVARLRPLKKHGLYDPAYEHDACGVGLVADIRGSRSHDMIDKALEVLENLTHRGARGADPETGDGAGILIQLPHEFMADAAAAEGIRLPEAGRYGVAMVFFPEDESLRAACEEVFERCVVGEGLEFLGWRDVPQRPERIGTLAQTVKPVIRQAFIGTPDGDAKEVLDSNALERKLYIARKCIENTLSERRAALDALAADELDRFYVCSMSARTVVYKGLLIAEQLREFYPDLSDVRITTAFALVHARYSTNTLGEWKLAHPYRMLCHNGEINTVQGNKNWMRTRERLFTNELFGDDIRKVAPVTLQDESDTASFDQAFELLALGGREIEHVAAMMIPEPWYGHRTMSDEKKAFYEYHSSVMESWDGPAMMAFTDGHKVGAVLDRNGFRPMRYLVTKDDLLVMASETGVLKIPPEDVAFKRRLQPGMMFLLDFDQGRIIDDEELKHDLATRKPYREWIRDNAVYLDDLPAPEFVPGLDRDTIVRRQQVFGYSQEELRILLNPLAEDGSEAYGSMGSDTPLAVLSDRPQNLFSYFKQQFAQVSNPPLDKQFEKVVTQMSMTIGRQGNLFDETPEHCRQLRVEHPVLTNHELAKIRNLDLPGIRTRTVSTLWPVKDGARGLRAALDRVRDEAAKAVEDGYEIIVLSDRGVDSESAPIPSILATGAVHHHLIREGLRLRVGLVVESGDPREVHHFAVLYGYGANAVNPYLTFETISDMLRSRREIEDDVIDDATAERNFVEGIEKGVLNVMAKMGVSTLQSYHGAQIFEGLGLSQKLVDEFFTWTPTKIQGIGIDEIAQDCVAAHKRAFPDVQMAAEMPLDIGGVYQWRAGGEHHMYNPETVALLQDSVNRNDARVFAEYSSLADDETRRLSTIRGLLEFKFDPDREIPLSEVEPASEIVKRFATGAISLGSISREAHETLAIAMNRLGARSNTGEGGEDSRRYTPDPNGDSRSSSVKQVASGRFGVTINYLTNATDLQIKMAQGSKPGEGGHLPGHKIDEYIGLIRRTTPGVDLISPPPHHDIYSIEDLAQLIHDLKNANDRARIHVKLVSKAGVGTIAVGVAKGKGDVVLISGDSGGTGSSPLSSIKHAGLPWELGLAETQYTLVANGLRSRIVVQTDGQIKTARDVAIAAILGADEWGIATGALIALGCIMLRKCHLNTCTVGIATQDPELRKDFRGRPEAVVNFFNLLAGDLRLIMSKLGVKTVNDMIGRTELLEPRRAVEHWKARGMDVTPLLAQPDVDPGIGRYASEAQDHGLENALDHKLIATAKDAIVHQIPVRAEFEISNQNRTVGAMLSNRIAQRYGDEGLPEGTIDFTFNGSAGQSFGAFLAPGVTFRVHGDANDYLGKGLSGGRLILVPPDGSTFVPEENIITGNVNLYGATGGQAFIRGVAGERFCVRNSGAEAVVEGVGDHGCEYMTGGRTVILGPTGRNFAAGMSGGEAYVLDEDGDFYIRCNQELVDLDPVQRGSDDELHLKGLIEQHLDSTSSPVAGRILADWDEYVKKFVKVMPIDYKRVLEERRLREESGAEELVRYG